MEQIYGAVTPFNRDDGLSPCSPNGSKVAWPLTSKQIQLVALGFSFLFITAFQLLTIPAITPFAVFSSSSTPCSDGSQQSHVRGSNQAAHATVTLLPPPSRPHHASYSRICHPP